MKIVFFGNTKYSVIVAEAVHKKFGLSLVVTNPDRPSGRGHILAPSPVKVFALEHQIPTLTPENIDQDFTNILISQYPNILASSIFVLADYGKILPPEILALPRYSALCVHHSLLPKYRGPSPAPTAILNGEKVSGVTIIRMNERVDAGEILAQEKYRLKPDETTDSLLTQLNTLGGQLILPMIESYLKGTVKPVKQDESKATFTKRIKKEDGFIDLDNPPPPETMDRMIRAYHPWPGVWSRLTSRTVLVQGQSSQGKVIKFLPERKIQVEGGKPITIKDFLNGYPEAKVWISKIYPA